MNSMFDTPARRGPLLLAFALLLFSGAPGWPQVSARSLNPEGQAMYPAWSPDGERIAFMTSRDGNYEIYTMRSDGSELKRLTNNLASDGLPSWSPDGKWIAYTSDDTHRFAGQVFYMPRPFAIFLVDPEGENRRRVTNKEIGGWRPDMHRYEDSHPVWSPDGRSIAFLSDRRNGFREIFVLDVETEKARQITYRNAHHNNLVWTPDSRRIVFDGRFDGHLREEGGRWVVDSRANPIWGLFSVDVTEGSPADSPMKVVINQLDSELEYDAAISPDGKTIAFRVGRSRPEARTGLQGLYFASMDDIAGTMKQRSEEDAFWARWSADGRRIAFTSTRDGHREIYVMKADGADVRRLTRSR